MAEFDKDGNLIPGTNKVPGTWKGPIEQYQNTPSNDGRTEVPMKLESGPLKDLYKNPYGQKALYYPRDLGQLDKGHSIQFDIRDIKPAEITPMIKAVGDTFSSGYKNVSQFATQSQQLNEDQREGWLSSLIDKSTSRGAEFVTNTVSKIDYESLVDLKPETTKIVNTVRLYMPDSLQFSYDAQYDKLSVAEAINSIPLVGSVTKAITSTVSESEIGKAITNKLGYTFNPQQQTLFEGIDFREFQLDFTFTPTSREEAATVQEIIKVLRVAAAPTKVKATGGFFFVPPSVFNISFFFNSQINYSIPPIRPCVLQNITLNYAPNGWAAMKDGSPVQTTISLSFRELDLVDRDNIKQEMTMNGVQE